MTRNAFNVHSLRHGTQGSLARTFAGKVWGRVDTICKVLAQPLPRWIILRSGGSYTRPTFTGRTGVVENFYWLRLLRFQMQPMTQDQLPLASMIASRACPSGSLELISLCNMWSLAQSLILSKFLHTCVLFMSCFSPCSFFQCHITGLTSAEHSKDCRMLSMQ